MHQNKVRLCGFTDGLIKLAEALVVFRRGMRQEGPTGPVMLPDCSIIGCLDLAFPGEAKEVVVPVTGDGPIQVRKMQIILQRGFVIFQVDEHGESQRHFSPPPLAEGLDEKHGERFARLATWAGVVWTDYSVRNKAYREMPLNAYHDMFKIHDTQWREAVAKRQEAAQAQDQVKARQQELAAAVRTAKPRIVVIDRRHPQARLATNVTRGPAFPPVPPGMRVAALAGIQQVDNAVRRFTPPPAPVKKVAAPRRLVHSLSELSLTVASS